MVEDDKSALTAPALPWQDKAIPAQPDTTTWPGMQDVLKELFGPHVGPGKGSIWTTGFHSVATGESWQGQMGIEALAQRFPTMQADLYFSIGVVREEAARRSNAGVVAQPLLIADDIGTKIDRAKWEALFEVGCPRPTAEIETSPGNWTYAWALAGDATGEDRWRDMALIRAYMVDAQLTDDVMDPARYIRLPGGWNSKPKYRGVNGDGPPPAVKLTAFRRGRVSIDALGEAIVGRQSGVALMGPGLWRQAPKPASTSAQALLLAPQAGAGALVRTADLSKPEALLRLADEIGMQPRQVRAGVVEALCPNIGAHTTRVDTGFAFLGGGLVQCNHASCQHLRTPDFVSMMMARMDEQAGRFGAGAEWLAREELRDAGALHDPAGAIATANAMADRASAGAQQAAAQAVAQTRAKIMSAPFGPVGPLVASQIPPRRWRYGRTALAGFLSFLVAPGGAGKSALAMVEAVAMAAGRELLLGEKSVEDLRTWYFNAEDDLAEMQRRLAATLKHFGLTHADLNGNLFLTSGRDMKLQLARMGRDGPEIVPGVVDALVERLVDARIDVLILDPLGALHALPENSNEAANLLLGALREIAHRADVALIVLHHAGKAAAMDMDAAGAGASRGASAFVDGARVVRQIVRMTEREAARFGIAEGDRRDYLRVENGKANLARAENARWLHMVDVPLGNGAGLWPLGDRVGVVERWTPPDPTSGTATDLARVQAAIDAATQPPRLSPKSSGWVGFLVAQVLGLNIGPAGASQKDRTAQEAAAYARVRALVDCWVRGGYLIVAKGRDPQTRHEVDLVSVGKPADLGLDVDPGPLLTAPESDAENAPGE